MSRRIAVLVSGRGSNLQALLDAIAAGSLDAHIVGVFSNQPQAPALARVPESLRWSADAKRYPDRAHFDADLAQAVQASRPDWVICAGYMRILGAAFIAQFQGRLLNIHPSLLPRHRGLHTHARALAAGDHTHGASVHWVIPELDAGTVIAQVQIPVLPDDTPESLALRLLPHEHTLLVAVAALAVSGRLAQHGDHTWLDGQPMLKPMRLNSAGHLCPSPAT